MQLCTRALVTLAAAVIVAACTGPALDETEQASSEGFVWVLIQAGIDPTRYNGYGCFCGMGNGGDDMAPVDAVDTCCQTHDEEWEEADHRIDNCDCKIQDYDYTVRRGVVTCTPNQDECAMYCCRADAAFAACVIETRPSYNPNCRQTDRPMVCKTTPGYDCCADADCDGGQVCAAGECVPACGGDGFDDPIGECPMPIDEAPPPDLGDPDLGDPDLGDPAD